MQRIGHWINLKHSPMKHSSMLNSAVIYGLPLRLWYGKYSYLMEIIGHLRKHYTMYIYLVYYSIFLYIVLDLSWLRRFQPFSNLRLIGSILWQHSVFTPICYFSIFSRWGLFQQSISLLAIPNQLIWLYFMLQIICVFL